MNIMQGVTNLAVNLGIGGMYRINNLLPCSYMAGLSAWSLPSDVFANLFALYSRSQVPAPTLFWCSQN
jgi:hypothetical protein